MSLQTDLTFSVAPEAVLLATKLYVPQVREQLVSRPRLTEALDANLWRKLTLVSAPAGYGKTTLMGDWMEQHASAPLPLAWIHLDEGDNDPVRFLTYVTAALGDLHPECGAGILAALQSPEPPPPLTVVTALINEIAAQLPTTPDSDRPRTILVLDDYHAIDAPEVHEAVTFLLDHLPRSVHVILLTRVDPPLPLASMRVRGQLHEIRAGDLRFTLDETDDFLNAVMELALDTADVVALEERTEGWIAAVQLAALSLAKSANPTALIRSFSGSHHYLVDYLTDEVLRQQPERIKRFLLETSILERLTASLVEAVTGQEQGQTTLEHLESANLFITPLDQERQWYRYHQVFVDFLRERLHHHAGEEGLAELHRRAYAWYEKKGYLTDAVKHALAAEDFAEAAALVEQAFPAMLMRGEMLTLTRWWDALPGPVGHSRPRLALSYGWLLVLSHRLDPLEKLLDDVAEAIDPQSEGAASWFGEIAALRGMRDVQAEESNEALEQAQRALELLPESAAFARGMATYVLGLAFLLKGKIAQGVQILEESKELNLKAGNLHIALRILHTLASFHAVRGDLRRAMERHRQSLDLATEQGGRRLPIAAMAYLGTGEIHYVRHELEAAERNLWESVKLAQQWGEYEVLLISYLNLGRVYRAMGDREEARRCLVEAEKLAREQIVDSYGTLKMRRAQWQIEDGDLEAGQRWAEAEGMSAEDELPSLDEFNYLVLAHLLVSEQRFAEAFGLLQRLYDVSQAKGWGLRTSSVLALWAAGLESAGRREEALEKLDEALRISEPEQVISYYTHYGQPVIRLLEELVRQGRHTAYAKKLLDAMGAPTQTEPSSAGERGTASGLVEALTEREMEVLELLARGYSNRQVAESLFLAVGTIKKHVHNIYQKLGVHSRTQALVRAQELGLVE